jgi:hypothetical protein
MYKKKTKEKLARKKLKNIIVRKSYFDKNVIQKIIEVLHII